MNSKRLYLQPLYIQLDMSSAEPSTDTTIPRGCSNLRLRRADRVVTRFYDGVIAPRTGLKTSQYTLLSHVATLSPVRPADLAQRMGMDPSTLTRNLQPLVAAGWVHIGPGSDARSREVTITEAGRAKRADAQQAWKLAQLAFNQRIGDARVAQLHRLLDECLALLAQPPQQAAGAQALQHSHNRPSEDPAP